MSFELRETYRKAFVKKVLLEMVEESLQKNFHFPLKTGLDFRTGRYYITEQRPFPFGERKLFSVTYSWHNGNGIEYTVHDPGVTAPAKKAVRRLEYNFRLTAKKTP